MTPTMLKLDTLSSLKQAYISSLSLDWFGLTVSNSKPKWSDLHLSNGYDAHVNSPEGIKSTESLQPLNEVLLTTMKLVKGDKISIYIHLMSGNNKLEVKIGATFSCSLLELIDWLVLWVSCSWLEILLEFVDQKKI